MLHKFVVDSGMKNEDPTLGEPSELSAARQQLMKINAFILEDGKESYTNGVWFA